MHCKSHLICTARAISYALQEPSHMHCKSHLICTARAISYALQEPSHMHCKSHLICTARAISYALQEPSPCSAYEMALAVHMRWLLQCIWDGFCIDLFIYIYVPIFRPSLVQNVSQQDDNAASNSVQRLSKMWHALLNLVPPVGCGYISSWGECGDLNCTTTRRLHGLHLQEEMGQWQVMPTYTLKTHPHMTICCLWSALALTYLTGEFC